MNYQILNRILTKKVKSKFPEQIDDIIVNQDDFGEYNGRRLLDTKVIVVLNKYDDIEYEDEIKDYIRAIEETIFHNYLNDKIQIVFARKD
jgi:hypothetical protein